MGYTLSYTAYRRLVEDTRCAAVATMLLPAHTLSASCPSDVRSSCHDTLLSLSIVTPTHGLVKQCAHLYNPSLQLSITDTIISRHLSTKHPSAAIDACLNLLQPTHFTSHTLSPAAACQHGAATS